MDPFHQSQARRSAKLSPNALLKELDIWWNVGHAGKKERKQHMLEKPLGLLTREIRSIKRKWQK